MSTIQAKDVSFLRQETGAGMLDCKRALEESGGDLEAAKDILRKRGIKVMGKRSGKSAEEGIVIARNNEDHTAGLLLGLACETDFVSRNERFDELANEIAELAVKSGVSDVAALADVVDGEDSVGEKVINLSGVVGEKIEITFLEVLEGEYVTSYVHSNRKLGVLCSLRNGGDGDLEDVGKDIAMQIAAMNPLGVIREDLDSTIVSREQEIARDQIAKVDKPDRVKEGIVKGKLNKFFSQNLLLDQSFIKDQKISVKGYLDGVHAGLTVSRFVRKTIGK